MKLMILSFLFLLLLSEVGCQSTYSYPYKSDAIKFHQGAINDHQSHLILIPGLSNSESLIGVTKWLSDDYGNKPLETVDSLLNYGAKFDTTLYDYFIPVLNSRMNFYSSLPSEEIVKKLFDDEGFEKPTYFGLEREALIGNLLGRNLIISKSGYSGFLFFNWKQLPPND